MECNCEGLLPKFLFDTWCLLGIDLLSVDSIDKHQLECFCHYTHADVVQSKRGYWDSVGQIPWAVGTHSSCYRRWVLVLNMELICAVLGMSLGLCLLRGLALSLVSPSGSYREATCACLTLCLGLESRHPHLVAWGQWCGAPGPVSTLVMIIMSTTYCSATSCPLCFLSRGRETSQV